MLAMFLLEMVFLSLGIMLGCVSKSPRKVGSVAIGVILGLYFLSIIAGMNENLDWLKWLTVFGWFNASEIFRSGTLELIAVLLTALVVMIFLAVGYASYDKRDLYI
jgi:ABC-2 type transport system permease protein